MAVGSVLSAFVRPTVIALSLLALAAAALAGARCAGTGPSARANVVLVTVETFRKDHLGAKRDGIPLTPHLDALAARGTSFERAYAASSFTLPSLHTLATGEPPPVHRVRFWTKFGNRYRGDTLAGRFAAAGYRTGFAYSAYIELTAYPILQRDWNAEGARAPIAFAQRPAGDVLAAARAWLDANASQPFFLWVHLFEPHTPYGPPMRLVEGLADPHAYRRAGPATFPVEQWVDTVPDGQGAALADALHAAEVRAADEAVGALVADLARRGLAEKTVVCVVADHGENLAADPPPRWDHGVSADEQLIHVPLVLAGPGVAAGRADDAIARHLDLPPTLLRLAGIDPPSGWRGRDLFGRAPAPRFAIAECTVDENHDAPMFSVTDGAQSLRLWSVTSPWRAEMRDERARGAPPRPVALESPPPFALPWVEAWREEAAACAARAAELNEPGDDRGTLSPDQEAVLKIGYMGGKK